MKIKRRKHIASLAVITILTISLIPAESFVLADFEPEISVLIEEMDEADILDSVLLQEEQDGDLPDLELSEGKEETDTKFESEPVAEVNGEEEKNDTEPEIDVIEEEHDVQEENELLEQDKTEVSEQEESENLQNRFMLGQFLSVKIADTHSHNDINYTEWDQSNSLPSAAGDYYLASDVTISSTWNVPSGTTNLCLNGHTIKGSGVENVIRVNAGCTLMVCDCGTTGTITGSSSYNGYRYGGGVYAVNGHFILKSGTISGNSLKASVSGGGGVEIEGADALFDMYGGTICNNEAGYGGGVYVRGGTFNFYDGVISNNKAVSTDGGGVHIYGSASTFNMYSGSIINNTAKAGGGIGVSGGGTVNISGGTISDNTSTQVGGGITNRRTNASGDMNANITISGTPVISGNIGDGSTSNVYLYNGIVLNIGGVLESDAVVGVTLQNGTGAFTSGLSGKGNADSFTSDNGNYEAFLNNSKEAEIGIKPHEHDNATFTKWTSANSLPTAAGNYYLDSDVTISSRWNVPSGTTNLCLNGHGIKMTGSGSVIYVGSGRTFNLCDCGKKEHKFKVTAPASNGAGLATVDDTLTTDYLTFNGGYITGGSGNGGGIRVYAGTLNINGGNIIGNKTGGDGGGIYAEKGGTVNMYAGTISYNTAKNGGGIYAPNITSFAKINLYGGRIEKNYVSGGHGGGIYGGTGVPVLLAGTVVITNNFATGEGAGGMTVAWGGASAHLNIKDSPYVYDNLNEKGQSNMRGAITENVMKVVGVLGSDCKIGLVNAAGVYDYFNATFNHTIDPNELFPCDEKGYTLIRSGNDAIRVVDDLSVSATGYEGDYDGNAHGITVTIPDGATVKYGEQEGSYTLNDSPSYVNAGTYTVYYEVSKAGYNAKSGSATVKINPIDVTVTITGRVNTAEYDGNIHSVNGYDVVASSTLYDVENSVEFSGNAFASQTNVGTSNMGLTTEQFKNINSNFNNVVFVVTDGYQTINPIDASITTAPKSKGILAYIGSEQELIEEGAALGGTLYYATGDDEASPDDAEYRQEIPKASDAGYYYIWYKVKGDENHNDIAPQYVKTTLAAEDWVTVRGIVCDSTQTSVGGAVVKLMQGKNIADTVRTDADGEYCFAVPKGIYNIVTETDDVTVTNMVDVSENITNDVSLSNASTQSILEVVGSDRSIVVGGLSDEAEAIRIKDNIPSNKNVALKLTVESISESGTEGAQAIDNSAKDRNLEFLDLTVEKNIDSEVTVLTETQTVLEFAIPCPYANKRELTVYHYHGSEILTLTEISSKADKADGTFYVDKENKMLYVYLNRFSTIAMGYKPYYSVKSNISLGSFDGNVSVTLTKEDSGEKYGELNDVSLDNISFSGITKGDYLMTIIWQDGAQNTLTLPCKVK